MKVSIQMAIRIAAPKPLYVCDDHELWQKMEPKIRGRRRKEVARIPVYVDDEGDKDADDEDFEDVDGYLYNSMQKDD